jgi:hypothetical protein
MEAAMNNDLKGVKSKIVRHIESTRRSEISKIFSSYKSSFQETTISEDNISYIIRCCPSEYIVFLDIDFEYDWETTNEFYNTLTDKEKDERDAIISDIEQEQHIPAAKYLDKKSKKSYYCLLGECCLYAITKNFSVARKHLQYAKEFIENRKVEITRKWQLSYCILILLFVFILQIVVDVNAKTLSSWFSIDVKDIQSIKYLTVGVIGATLSIILKNGKRAFSCESGQWLNFLEVVSKMIAAGISCFIIILLFKLDLIFTALKDNHSNEILYLLCIMAGFSERLIPSILQKIESKEIQEENKNDA